MLVSKNPYVVEARVKRHSKNPHFALKTGEKFTRNLRLKSLIFIVEKHRTKLLFNFSDKKYTSGTNSDAFGPVGRNVFGVAYPYASLRFA